ncbi:MAG TPA: ABC transporter ATP-binding protein [Dehalococcoidia bacterium]|nr:ABC transporter ATP-binding protein [Dehalococcoidia bacterium]
MNHLLMLEGVKMYFQVRSRFFGSLAVKAVDGVSLEVKRAETLAVVGESGSGKSTLGRVSLRLIRPSAGRVIFDGEDITAANDAELKRFRKRAQGIFQDPFSSIDPFMNIYQILEEPLFIHGLGNSRERRRLIYEALEEVKLTPPQEFAPKYPDRLSGGQRQRVGIARALILRPDYVVADEPVSMIDASSRAEILYLLRELQDRHGMSFLYITHDIATARHFSHRIAVMYLGRIVETAPTKELIEKPRHPYTMALIEAVPSPDPANRFRERRVIPGEPASPTRVPPGCRLHPRCPLFIRGKCDVIEPPLIEVMESHYAACHLYC